MLPVIAAGVLARSRRGLAGFGACDEGPGGMCVCTCKPVYSSSLTDAEWALIEPLIPAHDPHAGGRLLKYDRQLVLDSILYVLVSGCPWRFLPHDLVPWDAAYRRFAPGVLMAPGMRCMTRCGTVSASSTGGTCSRRRRYLMPSR